MENNFSIFVGDINNTRKDYLKVESSRIKHFMAYDNLLEFSNNVKHNNTQRIYLHRVSTPKPGEIFYEWSISNLLKKYDTVLLYIESTHKPQISRLVQFAAFHSDKLFDISSVDRLLKTSDESLIELPPNIQFIDEDEKPWSYPAQREEIYQRSKKAREASDKRSTDSKMFHNRRRDLRIRRKCPKSWIKRFKASSIALARSPSFHMKYTDWRTLRDYKTTRYRLQTTIARKIAYLRGIDRDIDRLRNNLQDPNNSLERIDYIRGSNAFRGLTISEINYKTSNSETSNTDTSNSDTSNPNTSNSNTSQSNVIEGNELSNARS
jgi:hypothetical protein